MIHWLFASPLHFFPVVGGLVFYTWFVVKLVRTLTPVEPKRLPRLTIVGIDVNNAHIGSYTKYDLGCLVCGRQWSAYKLDSRSPKDVNIRCVVCGEEGRLPAIRAAINQRLTTQKAVLCKHCKCGPKEHADNKCLFGPTYYEPYGEDS